MDAVAGECEDVLAQLNVLIETENAKIQERLAELTQVAAGQPARDEAAEEQNNNDSLVVQEQGAETEESAWTEITGLTFRHKPMKLDGQVYPSCSSSGRDQRLKCEEGDHSRVLGQRRHDIDLVFEVKGPDPGECRYKYSAKMSSFLPGTMLGQSGSLAPDDSRLAAFHWLEHAKKDLQGGAERESELEALREKLSAATCRSNKMEDLVANAVSDVIVARQEKSDKTGIALPRALDNASVHQELYRAHKARLKELEERRDSLKERLAACTMAFVQAHARREAAEDKRDGRKADPTPEEMKKPKQPPPPWLYVKPPPAFTKGKIQ